MHVAQGQGNQSARHALVGVRKGVRVGAGKTAGRHALQGEFVGVCRVDDALQQVVLDRGAVGDARAFAGSHIALLDLVHHRGVRAVRDVGDDGHIGLDALGDHLGAAQSDFLLHAVGDVEAKRQVHFVFLEQAGHFGDHESTGAVVQSTSYVPLLVEQHEGVLIGDDAPYVDAHLFDLGLVFGTDVEENVFQGGGRLLACCAGVDGGPAKDGLDDALLGVDVHALGRGDLVVAASVAAQVDKAVAGDVVHEPADFVGVRLDDHLVFGLGIDDAHDCAIGVYDVLIDVGLDIIEPHLLTGTFETGGRGVVEVSLQKLL